MSSPKHETSSSSSELTTTDETAATCLMLLSKVGELRAPREKAFDCKTCGKIFSTFQALGGHRASHKKPKLDQDGQSTHSISTIPAEPRSHRCSICGADFALGQALGGHMRRHRDSTVSKTMPSVVMRSNGKRVCLGLDLDLNLTPRDNDLLVESDLKLQLGKRDYEDSGRLQLQEYDLRMQMGKRRRLGDAPSSFQQIGSLCLL